MKKTAIKKPKVVIGCYFCDKGYNVKDIAVDKKGNCILSDNPKLKKYDNHFICKKCYKKVKNFFTVTEE